MSWNYTTKAKVSNTFGLPQESLQDAWSDWVEDLIENWMGYSMAGTSTYTSEVHNGDGTALLFVRHPPIVSVSSLVLTNADFEDALYTDSDYKVFDYYIELVNTSYSSLDSALWEPNVFPIGVGNVEITYVGGSTTIPKRVELAATQMVATIALVSKREGADLSLKYSRTTQTNGEQKTFTEQFGLQSSLQNIMKTYLPRKVMMR